MDQELSSKVTSVNPLGANTKPKDGKPWLVTPTAGSELTVTLANADKVDLVELTPQLGEGQQRPDNLDELRVSIQLKETPNSVIKSYSQGGGNAQAVSSNIAIHNSQLVIIT